ncbi:tRNA (adenosine(37)-N6)-dimethylallyltransferase MiaA [Bacillus niameyensis]|uniref:tRNA (adenosine(37)-N6)-dimethylallyltransferase MiaA n=1 Tax=Bacillus niameyensis TaxID=1522308 RepID=UPI000783106B|nr:tRNA (adenosine(37)-N6)-dimethylallyltransferase MiaA [Bacillus niameyensis]
MGPTAVGKTNLSIEIAKRFDGEIISGDSMQIYKGMDIGTAKITNEEMQGIPHHLIDIINPDQSFSVAEFQTLVRAKIKEIQQRGRLPIIVGGTGLYIQAVLYDYQFSEVEGDVEFRMKMEERVQSGDGMKLYKELEKIDPISAKNIHPNNYRRVIRALEVYHTTGKTMTEFQKDQQRTLLYPALLIGLTMDRTKLYKRIEMRVEKMLEVGLVEEVEQLYKCGIGSDYQSMKAIGYKEILDYIIGKQTLEEAINQLKKNSRNYAKRQLTWFRNKMDVHWFDMTDGREEWEKTAKILDFIAGKLEIKAN